jgi:hypothetical protein
MKYEIMWDFSWVDKNELILAKLVGFSRDTFSHPFEK